MHTGLARHRGGLGLGLIVGLWAASAAGSPPTPPARASQPLNVILVLADDLGWSDLGCYGADLHETPHLDRLARQGVRFTQAYAASVCSPTRASLMTGKHYARLHITTYYEASDRPVPGRKLKTQVSAGNLPHAEVTLAEVFRPAGYLTAVVGKWHLGDAWFYPETQGFDVNVGGTLWGAPATYFDPYRGPSPYTRERRYVPHLEGGKSGDYLTDRLTDEALKVIDASAAAGRPFFLYLAHHAVHSPIEAKPGLVAHYAAKVRPAMRHRNAKYAAMVHSLDESVGRVLARLDERGLTGRTVVVFTSDNGGVTLPYDGLTVTDNAPLRAGKGTLYEGGVRVPLLVRWPGVAPEGAVCPEPVASADLFPTLSEAAGSGGGSAALDGLSLVPLLKSPASRLDRDELYFHVPHYYPTTTPVSAVRARDWKLIEYLEDGRAELYDLASDPSESHDLAMRHPDRADDLRGRLHRWREAVGARMPAPNPDFKP
jgi:arylsulfatase A